MNGDQLNPKKRIPWLEEWREFSKDSSGFARAELPEKLLKQVQRDLHPTRAQVWSKLLAIHGITGMISLFFCPQMGVGGWLGGHSLLNAFMVFGHAFCFVLCGAFFMGGGFLMAQLTCEKEELRKMREDRLILLPGLTLLSFGVLRMLSATFSGASGGHHHDTGSLPGGAFTTEALLWMLGALCVGWLFFKSTTKSSLQT